ncbi:hypothetical protein FNV43_RR06444 [Rhamnella rubrinervis]|uniref:Helicase C-terminal domain-containing protein n=1 Tax=Rhamnella rubrinervis TaxID=2594499 RepID=A0A8K0MLE6_9ROSA|nr:hypothetical protein FNV43_RR06444 [Rhamnella rubrinervis]
MGEINAYEEEIVEEEQNSVSSTEFPIQSNMFLFLSPITEISVSVILFPSSELLWPLLGFYEFRIASFISLNYSAALLVQDIKSLFALRWGYVGIHSLGFGDFLFKPELLQAIVHSGFEHPSEGKAFSFFLFFFRSPNYKVISDENGRHLSSEIWDGKNCCLCSVNSQQTEPVTGQVAALATWKRHSRILEATEVVGRGTDIERVNIVINYGLPDSADSYLPRSWWVWHLGACNYICLINI